MLKICTALADPTRFPPRPALSLSPGLDRRRGPGGGEATAASSRVVSPAPSPLPLWEIPSGGPPPRHAAGEKLIDRRARPAENHGAPFILSFVVVVVVYGDQLGQVPGLRVFFLRRRRLLPESDAHLPVAAALPPAEREEEGRGGAFSSSAAAAGGPTVAVCDPDGGPGRALVQARGGDHIRVQLVADGGNRSREDREAVQGPPPAARRRRLRGVPGGRALPGRQTGPALRRRRQRDDALPLLPRQRSQRDHALPLPLPPRRSQRDDALPLLPRRRRQRDGALPLLLPRRRSQRRDDALLLLLPHRRKHRRDGELPL